MGRDRTVKGIRYATYNKDVEGWDIKTPVPVIEKIVIERIHEDAVIPTYASEGDSGMDVYAPVDMLVEPGEKKLMGLGFRMEIPKHPYHELGYRWEAQMRPRSGLSLKTTLALPNSPGTIDNFYVSEVGAILYNEANMERSVVAIKDAGTVEDVDYETVTQMYVVDLRGNEVQRKELQELGLLAYPYQRFPKGTLLIRKGDRIEQIVFNEVVRPLEITEGKVNLNHGRPDGFGSSGVR